MEASAMLAVKLAFWDRSGPTPQSAADLESVEAVPKLPDCVVPVVARAISYVTEEEKQRKLPDLFKNIERLRQLRIEHRDLDDVISRLSMDFKVDDCNETLKSAS